MTHQQPSEGVLIGEGAAAPVTEMTGLRAGAIVFAGIGVANIGNYVFHLLAARDLGPAAYGDVATLAALTGIVVLPLGGVQVFVARHVAAEATRARPLNDDGYVTSFGAAALAVGMSLTVVLLVLSPVIQDALSINSIWSVVFAILFMAPSFLAPALVGAGQGRQRFLLVAIALAGPPVARIVFVSVALAGGLGVPGAMAATTCAAVVAVVIPFIPLRHALLPLTRWRPRISRSDLVALLPFVGGLLAITSLSTLDLVVAKAVFTDDQAGLYGSASLIGRVILYLPAAIVTVLLPKVSARVAAEQDTSDILVQSLLVTAAFCLSATALYAVAPRLILSVAFGTKYEGSADLLWMFGLAMTFYALLNVLLTYQLGHGAGRTSWLLLAAALVQGALFAIFHDTPRELLAISIAVGAILLVLHEALVSPILWRVLRPGTTR